MKSIRFYPKKFIRAAGIVFLAIFSLYVVIKWNQIAIRHDNVILEQYLEDYSYRFND